MPVAPPPARPAHPLDLHAPDSVQATQLSLAFLADLVLKTIYFEGEINAYEIAARVALPFVGVVDHVLEFLKQEEWAGVVRIGGLSELGYMYTLSDKGMARAREAVERSQYVGPAPVTIDQYREVVLQQSLERITVYAEDVDRALSHLVVSQEMKDRIGPAASSGRSLFLYGPPGNGKTVIASAIPQMLHGEIYIPYAVVVGQNVIRVFDSLIHKPVPEQENRGNRGAPRRYPDRRWVRIERPIVMVGGELTLKGLDLVFDPISRTYEAPFQMKANGGVFLIDDFGRQLVSPDALLNRWIVPLESRIDFLTLQNGMKLEIPFRLLIVFSTNLNPVELVDDAFLRRLRHKLLVGDPPEEQYHEIFVRVCEQRGLEYDHEVYTYLMEEKYRRVGRRLKSAHPRDLVDQIFDICRYRRIEPHLSKALIDQACSAYFADFDETSY